MQTPRLPAASDSLLHRRGLLGAGAALATGWMLGERPILAQPAAAPAPSDPPVPAADWFQISLAQWSLHRAFFSGERDPLDFARIAKREHGLAGIEYVNSFYRGKATDFVYLGELRQRAQDEGVKSLLIMIDGEGLLADADQSARLHSVEQHFKWIAAAAFLGCHSIRVNAGNSSESSSASAALRETQAVDAADSLLRLARVAEDYGLNVIVENHGGLSSDGSWLAGVMRRANHPRVGTLPDFGNFDLCNGQQYDRYRGVEELIPFAKGLSAKSHDFDEQGRETHTDYARMLAIAYKAGYRAWIGVEYEGDALSEADGIRATIRLLETLRSAAR